MADFVGTFGAYQRVAAVEKTDPKTLECIAIMRRAERAGEVSDPTYLDCKRYIAEREAATGKKIYHRYTGLPTGAYFGRKLGPLTRSQETRTQKEDRIFAGKLTTLLDAPETPPTDPQEDIYTNDDVFVEEVPPTVKSSFFDKLRSYLPSWWPWGLGAIALIGGGYYVAKQRGMVSGFEGMTPQQARFKMAAKSCKGKPGYRKCMSRKLRK